MKPSLSVWTPGPLTRLLRPFIPAEINCVLCGCQYHVLRSGICAACFRQLPLAPGPPRTKIEAPSFDAAAATFMYAPPISGLIQSLKFSGRTFISRTLAAFMREDMLSDEWLPPDLLVAVPMHPSHQRQRGYNQAELIAGWLSQFTGIPLGTHYLNRTRATPSQLNAGDRMANVRDAFSADERVHLEGAIVCVVDDVFTTGATLNECARALKTAGARIVYVLAAAQTELS